ncbi:MAG: 7TM diverse intracellular signaling domain-containing protein [Mucilaginibacter sp.]
MLKWSLILVLNILAFNSRAGIVFFKSNERLLIGKKVEVFQPRREVSFDEAVKSGRFVASAADVPNLGISPNSIWFRFTITNQSESQKLLLEIAYPLLNEVELFTPDSSNHYRSVLMGQILNFNKRAYKYPNYIFDLDIVKNHAKTYYLRIKGKEQIILPASVNRPATLWQNLNLENLITGIYLGVVIIMVLYNLFIFFSVGDRSYLYYVVYVLFTGLTQIGIKGYTFQYLWPNYPAFEVRSAILFACISGIAALMFAKKFLSTKQLAPKSNIALNILIGLFLAAFTLIVIGKELAGFQIMQVTTTLLTITVLYVSFMIMVTRSGPAKYFFIAWSVLLTGAIIFLLKDYGVLPYNNFTSYSMQAASAVEMCLLSFGLADRINILKKQKELADAESLKVAKENERIIGEQNIILEQRVEERTYELSESNQELNITLEDLKQTQSQLVESEKMASLGQLTAGIAHEINNPINFVTSNVSPLKRDIEMMFNAIEEIEKVGMSDAPLAEKQQKIKAYKEELDFDYLTVEINHLLKGIKEGANRTAEIVKGLKLFSRLDEDDLKKADLNEGLESTMVIANNLLNNKITVIKEYGDLPAAECYPGKLNQVFLNIISNAAYAVQKRFGDNTGGVISMITTSDEENIFIKIKDNGTGMDAEMQKKIFEPFFTTKDVGEGTGLGLSITYNTIKKHNGNITVNSAPGQGTEFILQIPIIFNVKAT